MLALKILYWGLCQMQNRGIVSFVGTSVSHQVDVVEIFMGILLPVPGVLDHWGAISLGTKPAFIACGL